jgi:hypothetical protein
VTLPKSLEDESFCVDYEATVIGKCSINPPLIQIQDENN